MAVSKLPAHVAIVGPIAVADVQGYLSHPPQTTLRGYPGAPLMGALIGELLSRGIRVTALTTDAHWQGKGFSWRAAGANFELCVVRSRRHAWRPNGRAPGRILDLFSKERKLLAEVLRRVKPDIVHAHWSYEFALAAMESGLKTLVTCHDDPLVIARLTRSPYRALRYLMAVKVFSRAKRMTSVSPYMCAMISRHSSKRVHLVPNPIAAHVLDKSRPRSRPTAKRVAMVANGWDKRKNVKVALEAFKIFREDEPEAELYAFGKGFGPDGQAVRWARANGLQKGVHFIGYMQHEDLIARLAAMDVLLHPSLEESFGVVVAEAMALGLSVVAGTASGAVPWVLGMDEGCEAASLLCDVSSSSSIRSALKKAFDSGYQKRSTEGVQRARAHFSPEGIVDQYMQQYGEVVRA